MTKSSSDESITLLNFQEVLLPRSHKDSVQPPCSHLRLAVKTVMSFEQLNWQEDACVPNNLAFIACNHVRLWLLPMGHCFPCWPQSLLADPTKSTALDLFQQHMRFDSPFIFAACSSIWHNPRQAGNMWKWLASHSTFLCLTC